ncbi:MAG: 2-oxoacid:acceptor oxidoreductase family protein [Heliobacteriaceae bacterium]|nr:2-oxoacid:acceptor oxidoreductase family protein [Heliobacteriaceae bacterium]
MQKVYDEFLKTADDWQLPATAIPGKKRSCWEIRLAGRGGQGIITAAILLAKAAIMKGNNAVQTHSYGPEMRGGYSRADVIIMEGTTDYPEVLDADLLVLMSPESLERYGQKIKRSATVIVDETSLSPTKVKEFYAGLERQPQRVMFRPITGRAREIFGRNQGANLIAAGMLTALTDAATFEGLLVAASIQFPTTPSRTISQALETGYLLATAAD